MEGNIYINMYFILLIIHFFYRNLNIFLSIVVWFHKNPNGEDLIHNFCFCFVCCSYCLSFMVKFSLQLKKVEVR